MQRTQVHFARRLHGIWRGGGRRQKIDKMRFFTLQSWVSLVPQMVKNWPAMQETQVQSLVWEDPLEKGMTTHASILTWIMPWTEEPGRL